MSKTLQEMINEWKTRFKMNLKTKTKSQAMQAWVTNAKRTYENIKNIELSPGYNTNDYNAVLEWVAILDGLKAAIEDLFGDFAKLKADHPYLYADAMSYDKKISSTVAFLMGEVNEFAPEDHRGIKQNLTTTAGDLKLQRKYESLNMWFKETFGFTEKEMELLANFNVDNILSSKIGKLIKWVRNGSNPTYKINQIFPGEYDGTTMTGALKKLDSAGYANVGTPMDGPMGKALPIVLGAGVAYFALKG